MIKKCIILLLVITFSLFPVFGEVLCENVTEEFSSDNPPVVAVVLSGGAAHGLAHIAALRILEEAGIPIDIIAGSSMGGIAAGLYSIGYSPGDLQKLVEETDWGRIFLQTKTLVPYISEPVINEKQNFLSFHFDKNGIGKTLGLLPDQRIISLLSKTSYKVSHIRDYDSFPIRFRAMGTDLYTGDEIVLENTPLVTSLRSTMSIPGAFTPYFYVINGEKHYVLDGGVVNNLPVQLARDMGADIVISFDVDSELKEKITDFNSAVDVLSYYSVLVINMNEKIQAQYADLSMTAVLPDLEQMEFWKYKDIIDQGEAEFKQHVPEIQQLAEEIGQFRPLEYKDPDRKGSYFSLTEPEISSVALEPGYEVSGPFPFELFSHLIGSSPKPREIENVINRIVESDKYESIGYALRKEDEAYTLSLIPVESLRGKNHFGGSFIFNASFSSASSSSDQDALLVNPGFSADLVFKELLGTSSYLHVNFELQNKLTSFAELYMPLNSYTYLRPYVEGGGRDFSTANELFGAADTVEHSLAFINAGQEIGFSLSPFARFGFMVKSVNSWYTFLDEEEKQEEQETALVLLPVFKWMNFEPTRFCHQGIHFLSSLEISFGNSDAWYRKFDTAIEQHIPLYANGSFSYDTKIHSFRGLICTNSASCTLYGWDGIPGYIPKEFGFDDILLQGFSFSHRFAELSSILSMDVYALGKIRFGFGKNRDVPLSDVEFTGGIGAGIGLKNILGEMIFGAGLNEFGDFAFYVIMNS